MFNSVVLLAILIFLPFSIAENATIKEEEHSGSSIHAGHEGIVLFALQWKYVEIPLSLSIAVCLLGIFKVLFHHATSIAAVLPESCLLIILGLGLGTIFYLTEAKIDAIQFDTKIFFLYLLPPIMLESAFSLHDRIVYENLGTILIFAVLGTLLNCFTIGITLFGFSKLGIYNQITSEQLTFTRALLFSALISAVDPVAVLAIFTEIRVNPVLYFLVFGESLLNDAVTVVLYRMMAAFSALNIITSWEIGKGVISFFIVSCGGILFGVIFGCITAIITRFTEHVRVVEPLAVLVLAYMSYLVSECFEVSGIIAIITCGVVQAQYAFANISNDSETTIINFSKMLSSIADCIIFLFLGLETMNKEHTFDFAFVLLTIACCLLYRTLGVTFFTWLVNKQRLRNIGYEEQFIMSYGGLRGAVCFSLVVLIVTPDLNPHLFEMPNYLKQLCVTTTIIVIFFTVFVQGMTMKPFVKFLRIRRADDEDYQLVNEDINSNLMDHCLLGIETILGQLGSNWLRNRLDNVDKKIKYLLQNNPQSKEDIIMKTFEDVMLHEHILSVKAAKGGNVMGQLPVYDMDGNLPANPQPKKKYSVKFAEAAQKLIDKKQTDDSIRLRRQSAPEHSGRHARRVSDVDEPQQIHITVPEPDISEAEMRKAFVKMRKSRSNTVHTARFSLTDNAETIDKSLNDMHRRKLKSMEIMRRRRNLREDGEGEGRSRLCSTPNESVIEE